MPRYIVVFGRRRMYADHSPENIGAAILQAHIRLVFVLGRQMDRSFDVLRHRNGRYTLTMLTDEGLPGGLILRPLGDGELWNNFDIGFNLVSDNYGRRDIWFRGGGENNNDVDDNGANIANENNNDENENEDNNHDEQDNYGRQDMGLGGVNENNNDVDDGANSANENYNDENENDDDKNNEGNDDATMAKMRMNRIATTMVVLVME
jgi:hypothetical protein